MRRTGLLNGLGAALLFGLSTPLAKRLLPDGGPVMLAALLYLGAGLGLGGLRLVTRLFGEQVEEAPFRRGDLPWLAGVVGFGGVLGPVLLLLGLGRVSGIVGSLLLNLEAPLTIVLAVAFFGDHLGGRAAFGALLVMLGAALLGLGPGDLHGEALGIGCIAAACLCWALDNNFTQRLSLRDPVAIVRIKGLAAGSFSLVLALATGSRLPSAAVAVATLLVGMFGYGVSVVLHIRAVRALGAARQATLFAVAPFAGALLSLPLLGEKLVPIDVVSMALLAIGIAAVVAENHKHLHTHLPLAHDHLHVHDEHHQHTHEEVSSLPHSHPHQHTALTHDHPHTPDAHHRHSH